jgi:hypothetical protein
MDECRDTVGHGWPLGSVMYDTKLSSAKCVIIFGDCLEFNLRASSLLDQITWRPGCCSDCRHYRYLSSVRVSRFSERYSGDSILLAHDAASAGNPIPTFRGKVLPLYSRVTGPMTPRLSVMWPNNEIFKYGTHKHVTENVCCAVEVYPVCRLACFFYSLFLMTDAKTPVLWPEVNALQRPLCWTSDLLKMLLF